MSTLARLVAAARGADDATTEAPIVLVPHVGLRTGSRWFAVPADAVTEVVPLPDATRLPAAPAHLVGVAMVRARLTAMLDLDVLVSGRRTPRLDRSRAVMVRSGDVELGLIAAETRGLLPFPPPAPGAEETAPPAERPAWIVREERVGGELYAVVDAARLIAAALPGGA